MNDDGVLALGLIGDDLRFRAHIDATATGAISLHDACATVDLGAGREVGARNILHQLIDADLGILQRRQATRYHFAEVVWRDIGSHTDRDTRRAIYQQIWHSGGKHCWYLLSAVIIIDEVDCFFVEISEERVGDFGHANFGVAHGGRRVAIY